MKENSESKISEDPIKLIVIFAKKCLSFVMNYYRIKSSYFYLLPSSKDYCDSKKKTIYSFFKEMVNKEAIKKGEFGTEIIERMIFLGELMKKKKDIINFDEDLLNEVDDFVKIAKKKGLEEGNTKNTNKTVMDFALIEWRVFVKEVRISIYFFLKFNSIILKDKNSKESEIEIMKEEENEKIKKCFILNFIIYCLCMYVCIYLYIKFVNIY